MTTTTSTTSAGTSTTQQLLSSLGTGSGLDTENLVKSLVSAQFSAQTAKLTAKSETLTKQISGVATLKSTVTAFSTALESLVKGGTLQTQPTVSDNTVLTAGAIPGKAMSGLGSTVTIGRLASAQAAASSAVRDRNGAVVTATTTPLATAASRLTLTLGTAAYAADGASMTAFTAGGAAPIAIDIPAAGSSLTGIAAAINGKKAGVTATIVTGADGAAYLSLKGATGTAQAFTLDPTTDPDGTMTQFRVAPGTANLTGKALNAQLTVDGIAVERATNTVSDLVPGVKLQLAKVSATPVTLGATRPTEAITQAASDFVDTYNEVLKVVAEQTNAVDGPLRADPAAKQLLRSLAGITLKSLNPTATAGTPRTLSELGVTTNRDGTLAVSSTKLAAALAANPDAAEAMFAYSADGSAGLSSVLKSLSTDVANTTYGLAASTGRYTRAQSEVTTDQATLATKSGGLTTRLTKQYSAMNAAVSSYKSTQAFIEQQVAVWTKSDNR